jgi:hypothetical protein
MQGFVSLQVKFVHYFRSLDTIWFEQIKSSLGNPYSLTKNIGNRRPCSNTLVQTDQLSVRLIQAVLIPNYPPSAGRKAGHYCIMFIMLYGGVCAQELLL